MEPDIVGDRSLIQGGILTAGPMDLGGGVGLVRINRRLSHRWLALDILFRDLLHIQPLVLLEAGLHDPRQDDPLGKQALASSVILGV